MAGRLNAHTGLFDLFDRIVTRTIFGWQNNWSVIGTDSLFCLSRLTWVVHCSGWECLVFVHMHIRNRNAPKLYIAFLLIEKIAKPDFCAGSEYVAICRTGRCVQAGLALWS